MVTRLIVIAVKMSVTVVTKCGGEWMNRKKERLFSLIHSSFDLYRFSIPIPLWFSFLQPKLPIRPDTPESGFLSLLCFLYLSLKFISFLPKARKWMEIAHSFYLSSLPYGRNATRQEVIEKGNLCVICQDNFEKPITLDCSHIFCEKCISEWLKQSTLCPLCKKRVPNSGVENDIPRSATTLFISFF